ncbi:hypothetical protein G3T14_18225 [Methylobacterium sp. BTF04]|uniref:hypothetical protein n=1 Tax=Methylobacterium sp. BTF04 TaxID=2708300 RepID=UPI0013D7499C|nr:hypothetical protein [Methylobacterium sp. BTF04]NEU14051.1 hypothetical protein [Methylobacterium sp. BTF04]
MTKCAVDIAVRDATEALMRDTGLSVRAIAAQTGARLSTIRCWNRRYGWRPVRFGHRQIPEPSAWPAPRRAAVARLYRQPLVEIGDLAVAMGAPRPRAVALFETMGLTGRRPGMLLDDGAKGLSSPGLRAALRGHIARQIARFDAALSDDPPATLDTARILRDLGGLKRLLDEAATDGGDDGADRSQAGLQSFGFQSSGTEEFGPEESDLSALRAQIAQRYAAGLPERADAGLPGEPAAAPDPGAGP